MDIKYFCPRWGSENLTWDDFIIKVKDSGYNGIEYAIPNEISLAELEVIWEKAEKANMLMIPQHYATNEKDFNKHYDQYSLWLYKIEKLKAIKVNSQTGKDFFDFEQNVLLINLATDFTEKTGTEVNHETHRGKFSFAPHITKEYLLKIVSLKLTLDISHWVNVTESYLDDHTDAVDLAIARTGHIHARVGYPDGPQISTPAAPEWAEALDIHLQWWDQVVDNLEQQPTKVISITPEFGPYPYMVHLPFTNTPIADQWANNVHMMQLLKGRYSR